MQDYGYCEATGEKLVVVSRKEAKENGLMYYFSGKLCKKAGHKSVRLVSTGVCVACSRLQSKEHYEEYYEEYYKNNAERIKEYQKDYRKKNVGKIKEYKKNNADRVKEYHKDYNRAYKRENANKIREYKKERYNTDENFRMACMCRKMLHRTLLATNQTKSNRTTKLLGYTHNDLMEHLEKHFAEGMSWDNQDKLHIDHRVPVSVLIAQGVTDPAIINSLDNLRPMWDEHNIQKSAMNEQEYFEQYPDVAAMYPVMPEFLHPFSE